MMDILKNKSGSTTNIQQIVVAASSWSQSLEFLMSTYIKEVHIVTACAIEAAIRLGVEMVGAWTFVYCFMYHEIIIMYTTSLVRFLKFLLHTESTPL